MSPVSFATRSFQVVDRPFGARDVVLGTLVTTLDARAMADALAWRRSRDFLAAPAEDAGAVLELRAIVALIDEIEALTRREDAGPLTLTREQVVLLAETTATYVAERGGEEFIPPPERDRLARLDALSQPLFDLSAAFGHAHEELRAQS